MICHGASVVGYWAVRVILTPSTAHGVLERELQLFAAMQSNFTLDLLGFGEKHLEIQVFPIKLVSERRFGTTGG
ncbi:hypothetical protein KFK09_027409 [Dendrobium nobile]|uniref:Uncharacterized protein n=1 Tax=Dendrobium nobile TaxID=94219 RepID=A0A8T3AAN2_DENNO|nr:hypothetical protein KFK09_027409 [Dendrobium nobile]